MSRDFRLTRTLHPPRTFVSGPLVAVSLSVRSEHMHKLLKALLVGALVALVVAPAAAQDDLGNVIIGSTFGSTGVNFNPITSSTATEQEIIANPGGDTPLQRDEESGHSFRFNRLTV